MMIQRNSDTGRAPNWFLSAGVSDNELSNAADAKASMTREEVIEAKRQIEECAEKDANFFVHEDLDSNVRSELSEYAEAVGLSSDGMKEISGRQQQSYEAVQSLASIEQEENEVERPDPVFDIGPKDTTDPSHFEKRTDWERAGAASKMEQRPDINNGVIPIRGADNVETSRIVGNRPGENSMADPDAIQEMAESKGTGTREQIRAGNEERKADIAFDKTNWEAEAISGMDKVELPQAGVHRTESPQSQNHSSVSRYKNSISQDGREDAPDKTMGETIAERNSEKKAEIQRHKEDEREWNAPQSSVPEKVSDLFADELEKRLNVKE